MARGGLAAAGVTSRGGAGWRARCGEENNTTRKLLFGVQHVGKKVKKQRIVYVRCIIKKRIKTFCCIAFLTDKKKLIES